MADTPFHIQGDEISYAALNHCERKNRTNRLTPGEYFSWTHAPPAPVELSGFYPHKSTPGTIKRSQLPLEVETCRDRTPAAQSVKGGTTDFPRRSDNLDLMAGLRHAQVTPAARFGQF